MRLQVPFNGRMRPVGEVIARSQAAVERDPQRLGDWVRLAYCHQQVLARPHFTERLSDQALGLEPNAVEAVILKADTLSVQGRDAEAFGRLDQALASKDQWRLFLTDIASPAQTAAQFAH
ncbi:MAG: hypothetical protein ACM3ST_09100 [Bdellovibrio bacteriovorus]